MASVIEKLRANHNKNAIRGRSKLDPSSETTKLRKRNEMLERVIISLIPVLNSCLYFIVFT